MKKWLRVAVALGVVVLLLVCYRLYALYADIKSQMQLAGQLTGAPTVSVGEAKKRSMQWSFDPVGTVESRQSVTISAKTAGRIVEMPFRTGDRVKKGDLLVRLDDDTAKAAILKKQGDLANARFTYYQQVSQQEMQDIQAVTGVDKARADLDAAQAGQLKSTRAYSATLTQAKSSLTQAQAKLVGSQAQLRQTEVDYQKARTHYERMLELQRQGFSSAADTQDAYSDALSKLAAVDSKRADVRSAEADVQNARAQGRKDVAAAKADIETSRFTVVSKRAGVSEAQANTAKAVAFKQQILAQKALVEAAEADLKTAQLELQDTILRSPVDGFVSDRKLEPGATTNPGNAIMTVQEGGIPWIVTPMPQEIYAQVHKGQPCQVRVEDSQAPDKGFPAHVISKDAAVDAASRQFNARIELDHPQSSIKPGMFARVKIEVGLVKDVLTVPAAALNNINQDKRTATVYQVVGHKVRVVQVGLGPGNSKYSIITQGLEGGEQVVVQTAGPLKEGQEVKDVPARDPDTP